MDEREARCLDGRILQLTLRRRVRAVALCRLFWDMSWREGYLALGFATFDAYLAARGISKSWAYFLKGVYRKLAVELLVPEREWRHLPLSRLQGVLKTITRANTRQVLLGRPAHVRASASRPRAPEAGLGETWLTGVYRLEPKQRPAGIVTGSRRQLRALVYRGPDGAWYASFPA